MWDSGVAQELVNFEAFRIIGSTFIFFGTMGRVLRNYSQRDYRKLVSFGLQSSGIINYFWGVAGLNTLTPGEGTDTDCDFFGVCFIFRLL